MRSLPKNSRGAKSKAMKRKETPPKDKLVNLCRELDMELDGVRVPATAAAILNGIRRVLGEIEDAD